MKLWKSGKEEMETVEQEFADAGAPEKEKNEKKKSIRTAMKRAGGFAKRRKGIVIVLILLLMLAVAFLVIRSRRNKMPDFSQTMTVETAKVERMDLTNSISVTGTIATAEGRKGSTSLSNLEVTAVCVEVGDEVQEGDIICTFDSSDIEEALATAKNNYAVNQQLAALDDYETQYAETVEQAQDALQEARDTRDAYKNAYGNAIENEENKKAASEKAQSALPEKKTAYETARAGAEEAAQAYEDSKAGGGISINDLDAYIANLEVNGEIPTALKAPLENYAAAKTAYEAAQKAVSEAAEAYEKAKSAVTEACSAYEQAQEAREKAQDTYEDTLEQAEDSYQKAKLNDQLISENDEKSRIEDYEEQLADCTVYASMSGVITSLSVEEGEIFAGGSIYEIQDMNYFIVEASVDEYDIVDIAKGMTAYVKTDSMGDEEMEAEVTYVAPTGTTGSQMGSISSTASYEIQITIKEPQERLRAGMTAKVSISLEESKDALAVPYDCVQTNEAGESVIYVDDNGQRKEVQVETGIETDYYIEVKSEGLSEGMTVYLSTPLLKSTGFGEDSAGEENDFPFNMGGDMGGGMGGAPAGGAPVGGGQMGGGPGGF